MNMSVATIILRLKNVVLSFHQHLTLFTVTLNIVSDEEITFIEFNTVPLAIANRYILELRWINLDVLLTS